MKIEEAQLPPNGAGRPLKYDFDKLEVGKRIVLEGYETNQVVSIVTSAHQYAKRHGLKFISRKDKKTGVVSIYRK